MKKKTNLLKAFRGPNGWYIAEEDEGTHYQPEDGGSMTRVQAERALAEAEAEDAESSEWGGR